MEKIKICVGNYNNIIGRHMRKAIIDLFASEGEGRCDFWIENLEIPWSVSRSSETDIRLNILVWKTLCEHHDVICGVFPPFVIEALTACRAEPDFSMKRCQYILAPIRLNDQFIVPKGLPSKVIVPYLIYGKDGPVKEEDSDGTHFLRWAHL